MTDTTDQVHVGDSTQLGKADLHEFSPTDEKSLREWEGLPDNAVILAAPFATTPPMWVPDGTWAMLVVAIDTAHNDGTGEVELFAGCWQSHQHPADRVDGDLVLRLDPSSRIQPPNLATTRREWTSSCCWPTKDSGSAWDNGPISTASGRKSSDPPRARSCACTQI